MIAVLRGPADGKAAVLQGKCSSMFIYGTHNALPSPEAATSYDNSVLEIISLFLQNWGHRNSGMYKALLFKSHYLFTTVAIPYSAFVMAKMQIARGGWIKELFEESWHLAEPTFG